MSKLPKVLYHTRTYSKITTNEYTKSCHIKSHLSSFSHYLSSHYILQVTVSANTFNVLYHQNSNPLFLIIVTCNHKMLLYVYFPSFLFALCAHFSEIHFNGVFHMLISTSTFFVSISTLTMTGKCLGIRIRIPYVRLHRTNLKIYSLKSFLPKISLYFYTLIIFNCKLEIITVTQIYFSTTSSISLRHKIATLTCSRLHIF